MRVFGYRCYCQKILQICGYIYYYIPFLQELMLVTMVILSHLAFGAHSMKHDCKNKMNHFFFSSDFLTYFVSSRSVRSSLSCSFFFVFHLILCHAYLIRKIFVSFLEALWPKFRLALFISIFGMCEQRNDGNNDDDDDDDYVNDEANVIQQRMIKNYMLHNCRC